MKVLIATDGSDASIDAARRGCALLATADEVTLLSVVSDLELVEVAGGIEAPVLPAQARAELAEKERSAARDDLARAAATLTTSPVVQITETGDAADVICRTAERIGADVIIVGTHARTGLGRLFLGSISEQVVRHAPCPVLVVREHDA